MASSSRIYRNRIRRKPGRDITPVPESLREHRRLYLNTLETVRAEYTTGLVRFADRTPEEEAERRAQWLVLVTTPGAIPF